MKVIICAMIKNEQRYLKEWLDYHISLGIDHFYLCEDEGSDTHKSITDEYDCVTLFQYREEFAQYEPHMTGARRQQDMYNWFLANHRDCADWCAFIDIDEFIHIDSGVNIHTFLEDYDQFDGLYLIWRCFNANGLVERPYNSSVRGDFTKWTTRMPKLGSCWKCILNLNHNDIVHDLHYMDNGVTVDKTEKPKKRYADDWHIAWIDHYFTKSWDEWCNRVLVRGNCTAGLRRLDEFFIYNPELRDRMRELLEYAKNKYDTTKII